MSAHLPTSLSLFHLKKKSVAQQTKLDPGRLMFEVSRPHTFRHIHVEVSLRTSDRIVAEAASYKTQDTKVHALHCNRTHNPSNRAAADVRLYV